MLLDPGVPRARACAQINSSVARSVNRLRIPPTIPFDQNNTTLRMNREPGVGNR